MRARITVKNLRLHGGLGIYPEELHVQRDYRLDLAMECHIHQAARLGQLAGTVDYAQLADELEACAARQHFGLLEQAGAAFLDLVFSRFPQVKTCSLVLYKDGVPRPDCSANLEISARRSRGGWKTC